MLDKVLLQTRRRQFQRTPSPFLSMTASLNPCRMRVPHAVIAGITAFPNALYAWISPRLLGGSSSPDHLIPFGPDIDRLVVGLNVSLDRARVENENSLAGTRSRWMDTMSLESPRCCERDILS